MNDEPSRRAMLGRSRAPSALQPMLRLLPGSGLATLIALAATAVAMLHGGPHLLYALFFGVAFNYLSREPRTQPGVEFCSRQLLRLGVGLLGVRITLPQIGALGWQTVAVVACAMVATIVLGWVSARRFGLTRPQGVLTGGSVAICGASAALAISAVLPRERGSERFTLLVVVAVTVMSTVAMVAYPLIARALALPSDLAGLFLGGTIHDVAQVAGAGYMIDRATGDVAIVVKLFRVALLALVVFVLAAVYQAGREVRSTGERAALVPWFLWLFVAMVATNSLDLVAPRVQHLLSDTSRACLVVAIAALGVKTSFGDLARAGWRPLALLLAETAWLAALVLGYVLTQR